MPSTTIIPFMSGEEDYRRILAYAAAIGLFVGLVSSVPILRWPNACCLWIILGGFAASYIMCRQARNAEPADGAIVGALFGLVYGLIVNVGTFLVNIPLNILGWGTLARGVEGTGILATLGIRLGFGILKGIALIVANVFEGVVFGALGGVLAVRFLNPGSASRSSGGRRPTLKR
jgi:hypothetical protein